MLTKRTKHVILGAYQLKGTSMEYTKESLKQILIIFSNNLPDGVDEVVEVCQEFIDDQEVLSESYQLRPNKLEAYDIR